MRSRWLLTAGICVCLAVLAEARGGFGASPILVGHQQVDISTVPDSAITSAAALRLVLRRASVGGNISGGLDSLYTSNNKYNRSLWVFSDRGNPGWQAKVDDFVSFTGSNLTGYDVFSMKFCYIDPDADWAYYRDHMLALEAANPTKKFVWWTIPIMTAGDGPAAQRDAFNQSVRTYCGANNKPLFDLADIECHTPAGVKVTDGSGNEAMYANYTDDGGHLNTTGQARAASAFWYLMARVSGWDPATPAEVSAWEAY